MQVGGLKKQPHLDSDRAIGFKVAQNANDSEIILGSYHFEKFITEFFSVCLAFVSEQLNVLGAKHWRFVYSLHNSLEVSSSERQSLYSIIESMLSFSSILKKLSLSLVN